MLITSRPRIFSAGIVPSSIERYTDLALMGKRLASSSTDTNN